MLVLWARVDTDALNESFTPEDSMTDVIVLTTILVIVALLSLITSEAFEVRCKRFYAQVRAMVLMRVFGRPEAR